MAKTEKTIDDQRTPAQLDAYAKECLRCADEVQAQAEALMKQSEEWRALAADAKSRANAVRAGSREQTAVPSPAKLSAIGNPEPPPAAPKRAAKRTKR